MQIQRLYLNQLRNNEHFQFHTEFKDLVENTGAERIKIAPLFNNNYLPYFKEEDDTLLKIMKNAYTEDKSDADRQRDKTFRGMVNSAEGGLQHFDPVVVASAKRLKILFDAYGNVARLPLQEETSAIYNLIEELANKYAADAKTVGIDAWVKQLNLDNQHYDELMKLSYDEDAARTEAKMKEVRTAIDKVYRSTVERLEALMVVEGDDTYATFVRYLNTIITKYENILAQRKGSAKAHAAKK